MYFLWMHFLTLSLGLVENGVPKPRQQQRIHFPIRNKVSQELKSFIIHPFAKYMFKINYFTIPLGTA